MDTVFYYAGSFFFIVASVMLVGIFMSLDKIAKELEALRHENKKM